MTAPSPLLEQAVMSPQAWVTLVLLAAGLGCVMRWRKVRREAEKLRGHAPLDPPDVKASGLAALFAFGMLGGAAVSLSATIVEICWPSHRIAGSLASFVCTAAGYYLAWRLVDACARKLGISRRPRYAALARWRVPQLLRASRHLLAACAPPALVLSLASGPDPGTDLSAWGFAYRWIAAAPALVLASIAASLLAGAAAHESCGDLRARRWRHASWGSASFALLWLNLLVWPYVALYYPGSWSGRHYAELQRLLEVPVFVLLGAAFLACFAHGFRSGKADKRLRLAVDFRRLSEEASDALCGWTGLSQKLSPDWYETSLLLEKTLGGLRVGGQDARLAADALALAAVRNRGRMSPRDLRRLHLHHVLDNRAHSSHRRAAALTLVPRHREAALLEKVGGAYPTPPMRTTPPEEGSGARSSALARAAGSVCALPVSAGAPDLRGRPLWEQAYVIVAAMGGLLPEETARHVLDPKGKNHVHRAQRSAYTALLDLAGGDAKLLRGTRAHRVLSDVFGEDLSTLLAHVRPQGHYEDRAA